MDRVFPFIPRAKHKTLNIKRAWVELKNSAQLSIDRARQIYTVNPTEHSIPTLHLNILRAILKKTKTF